MNIEKEAVSLQIKKEYLAPFMEKVLGKEQSISKSFHGSFVLDKNWLNNLYHLINQRIMSQHKADLVGFYFKINLANGYERALNKIEQFISFNEILSEEVIGFEFSLKYLVFFGEKITPEIQTINLIVNKKEINENIIKNREENNFIRSAIRKLLTVSSNDSKIILKIESTQRSFSDDLINIFDRELSKIITKKTFIDKVILFFSLISAIAILIFNMVFVSSFMSNDFLFNSVTISNEFKKLGDVSIVDLNQKVNYIFEYISLRRENSIIGAVISMLSMAMSCAFSILIVKLSARDKESFILFNDCSEDKYNKYRKKEKKILFFLFLTILLPIAINLLSNYIFSYFR